MKSGIFSPVTLTISLCIAMLLLSTEQIQAQNVKSSVEKAKSLLLGGNFREGIHGGFTIGNKLKSGLNLGYNPELNSMTVNGSFKFHFKGDSRFFNYSPYNLRLNPGMQLDFVDGNTEIINPYLAVTFGRDFFITKKWALSAEFGAMYLFDFETGYFPVESTIAPSGGLKLVRNIVK